ncbi:uncharacterized protein LOC143292581 [Babylonia areolata]|uniref:uncharacterized protein LOC143292581 n=1 Tax=Babylonia areolata TaxID=304850 RepID=UPI003FD2A259
MSGCRFHRVFLCSLVVWVVVLCGGVAGRSVTGHRPCPLFRYYDDVTGQCEHCGDLCDHAELWRSQERCHTLCADYLQSQQCGGEQFYDEQSGTCRPCGDLCLNPDLQDTSRHCHTRCPEKTPPAEEDGDGAKPAGAARAVPSPTPAPQKQQHNPSPHPVTWVLSSCVGLVTVGLGVTAVLLVSKRRGPPARAVRTQSALLTEQHVPLTATPLTEQHVPLTATPLTEQHVPLTATPLTEQHVPLTATLPAEHNVPLTQPEEETQPEGSSRLVVSGT